MSLPPLHLTKKVVIRQFATDFSNKADEGFFLVIARLGSKHFYLVFWFSHTQLLRRVGRQVLILNATIIENSVSFVLVVLFIEVRTFIDVDGKKCFR